MSRYAIVLFIVFMQSCHDNQEQGAELDLLEWHYFKLYSYGENPLPTDRGSCIRLTLEMPFGKDTHIMGIYQVADRNIVYQKKISNSNHTFGSTGFSANYTIDWDEIKGIVASLKSEKGTEKQVLDLPTWTIEANFMNDTNPDIIFLSGRVDEDVSMIQKLFAKSTFPWPIPPLPDNL